MFDPGDINEFLNQKGGDADNMDASGFRESQKDQKSSEVKCFHNSYY